MGISVCDKCGDRVDDIDAGFSLAAQGMKCECGGSYRTLFEGDFLVNATPHNIVAIANDGVAYLIPKSGIIPRVSTRKVSRCDIGPFPVVETVMGGVGGLPEKKPGVWVIVSRLVLEESKRDDLVAPGELIRDDGGNVIGCKGFSE